MVETSLSIMTFFEWRFALASLKKALHRRRPNDEDRFCGELVDARMCGPVLGIADDHSVSLLCALLGFPLPLDNLSQTPKGLIDRVVVGKVLSYIRFNDYNIGAFLIPFCVLAPDPACKIVFLKHVRVIFHFLHV